MIYGHEVISIIQYVYPDVTIKVYPQENCLYMHTYKENRTVEDIYPLQRLSRQKEKRSLHMRYTEKYKAMVFIHNNQNTEKEHDYCDYLMSI